MSPHEQKQAAQGARMPVAQMPQAAAQANPSAAPAGPSVQQPVTPPPPSRPYQMSPVPPQVTYTGGQLTISANNSTLADILNAVKTRTGTTVEFPPSAAQERVAVQLGPGNPRDVLAQLLHGSPFDYILLGSEQDPIAVTQITLTRRQAGGTAPVASGGSRNPAPPQPEPADEEDTEAQQPTMAQPVSGPPGQMPPPMSQPTPGQMVPGQPTSSMPTMQQAPELNAPAMPGTPIQPSADNPVKTPEQLLQELQRMQREDQMRRQQRPPR